MPSRPGARRLPGAAAAGAAAAGLSPGHRAPTRKPHALARSLAQGGLEAAPGASLELVAADLTQLSTLLPEMFAGVVAVVGCSAVKVAPKEGDTVDRAKYYQGIKFYDPEIVGALVCLRGRRCGRPPAGT